MTIELFRDNAYLRECAAVVTACDDNRIATDQSVFYPLAGGQPGDQGLLCRADGSKIAIVDCYCDRDSGTHWHVLEQSCDLRVGETVTLALDWPRRYRLMRLHSCMHMLCAVIPAPVTGGSMRDDGTARLDFDLPEPPDKEALEAALNRLTLASSAMTAQWITGEELLAQPELVRTMSVAPPMGSGRVRLVDFAGVDLQPCGGTHVADSAEIGAVRIQSIKKKGKQNRRITVELVDLDSREPESGR